MKRRVPSTTRSPAKLARLWLTLFALFAFTLQAYATQSHVHAAAITKQLPGKLSDDQANCPLCQATLHAGTYVTPSAASFVPPVLVLCGVFVATRIAATVQSAPHGWNSRAPPQT
ncbi:MAG TPA: hypothetical protein VG889_02180 [Rhizomicrobium sp.]|nr:hypothetical protein [Rhizomicrobium sp.]